MRKGEGDWEGRGGFLASVSPFEVTLSSESS